MIQLHTYNDSMREHQFGIWFIFRWGIKHDIARIFDVKDSYSVYFKQHTTSLLSVLLSDEGPLLETLEF